MQISLFRALSDKPVVNKRLSGGQAMTGTLRDASRVTDPVILIESAANISGYNYAYIPDFGRYYYISEMEAVRHGLWRLTLHVDVLMSYAGQLRGCVGIVDKQQQGAMGSPYIDDGSVVVTTQRINQTIAFSGGFSQSPYYILAMAGVVV